MEVPETAGLEQSGGHQAHPEEEMWGHESQQGLVPGQAKHVTYFRKATMLSEHSKRQSKGFVRREGQQSPLPTRETCSSF